MVLAWPTKIVYSLFAPTCEKHSSLSEKFYDIFPWWQFQSHSCVPGIFVLKLLLVSFKMFSNKLECFPKWETFTHVHYSRTSLVVCPWSGAYLVRHAASLASNRLGWKCPVPTNTLAYCSPKAEMTQINFYKLRPLTKTVAEICLSMWEKETGGTSPTQTYPSNLFTIVNTTALL